MLTTVKENLFVVLATVFLGATLAFSFTAYGQTSGGCVSCGGTWWGQGEEEPACYSVNTGAAQCTDFGNTCGDYGECENGEVSFEEA